MKKHEGIQVSFVRLEHPDKVYGPTPWNHTMWALLEIWAEEDSWQPLWMEAS